MRFCGGVLRHLAWRWLVLAPLGALGAIQAVRDEFLPPEQQELFRLPRFLPDWPWEWWIILFLALLFVFSMKGAYRLKAPDRPKADIDAIDAFDLILKRSRWAKKNARNWRALPKEFYEKGFPVSQVIESRLESAFKREIHRLLIGGELDCWGRESVSASSAHFVPENRIDVPKWREIEIGSDRPQVYARYVIGQRKGELAFIGLRFCERQIRSVFPMAWTARSKSNDETPFDRTAL